MAFAINEDPPIALTALQPLWDDRAPRKLLDACSQTNPFAGWKTWQQHLHRRRKPAAPKFLAKREPAVLWGWSREWDRDAIQIAIATPTSLAEIVIGDEVTSTPDVCMAIQFVALAYALPKLSAELPAETWWFLLDRLHAIASEAVAQRIDTASPPRDVLCNQLLAGELPLALGYLFPELRAVRALRDDARATFSESLIELTDGQGLPTARLLPVFAPLFACWTRARWLGKRLKRGAWSHTADVQYEWLVRNAIRLADNEGAFLLATPRDATWTKNLFRTALALGGDRGDYAAAIRALPRGVAKTHRQCKDQRPPNPSLNSDWSSITVMSDGWSQRDARIALSYVSAAPAIDITVHGDGIISGALESRTICDGETVQPTGEWEQLCWESGKRFNFLELGLPLTSGLRLERQFLFGRKDRILYFADIVYDANRETRTIQHSVSFPLGSAAAWKPESDTRDGVLTGPHCHAAVMPLALQEWRADPRGGSLVEENGRLILSQRQHGSAICCPMFFDLKRQRSKAQRTWRQLTVGDALEIVPNDKAVGYRIQSGDDQWLIYRSLGKPGNRTLLGHNIAGEFCAGRFTAAGKFKEWIEIEAV
jgi:hypothetical protein